MKRDRDTTRIIRSWLEDGATVLPDRVLDAVQETLHATPQRRAGWLSRLLPGLGRRQLWFGFAAAALVAAIFGGVTVFPRDAGGPGEPTPTPTLVPTAEPIPEARTLPQRGRELDPGWYALEGFPARIVFDVPAGYTPCSPSVVEQGLCAAPRAPALAFLVVENVVEDPCSESLRSPAPASLDELVSAISSLDGFEATPPVDMSIDGFAGNRLVVTAPSGLGCDLLTWATANRINGVGRGEVNELTILEIDGAFVMFSLAYFPSDPAPDGLASLRQVVDSIRIGR